MKILVFADSHTDAITMSAVVDSICPDTIIHLGDHIDDALVLHSIYPHIPMEYVKGNTDKTDEYPSEKLITIEGTTIFMTHGDTYGVQSGYGSIIEKGIYCGADIILFGHTHHAYLECERNVWTMNPGRIGRISSKPIESTYGLIDLDSKNGITCMIRDYDYLY